MANSPLQLLRELLLPGLSYFSYTSHNLKRAQTNAIGEKETREKHVLFKDLTSILLPETGGGGG